MEAATRNGLIAVGITIAVVGGGYLIYKKFFDTPEGNEEFQDNFAQLQTNLGKKANSDNVVVVSFNVQNNVPKNMASFYDNDRVIIFDSNKKKIMSGVYSDGGKVIRIDSSYGGKQSYNKDVYANLNLLIEKK